MSRVLSPAIVLTAALALAAFPVAAHSQTDTNADASGQGMYHFNTGTQEVVVDVVVTDDKGHPIQGLKQSDFTLQENNVPQRLRSFEEHVGPTAAELAKQPPMPKMPPGTFTNFSPVTQDTALDILLIDALNTPTRDQAFVRDQLKKYLKNAKAGTRIAIFGLTTHLSLLQGFTADPEILKAIIDKKNPISSVLLDDQAGGGTGMSSGSNFLSDMTGDDPTMASVIANVQQFEAEQASFQTQLRSRYTLDAMNELARYLASLPGRKNLIWFSGSFPLDILPDGDLTNPFSVVGSADDEFRQTTNLLARSQVAVYPVDAGGLINDPLYSASLGGSRYSKSSAAFAQDSQNFLAQNGAAHMTMMQMAEATGGHAYLNTNGLTEAVESAISTGAFYYTLTYSPGSGKWNGDYRKIAVKLDKPGYNLAYRRGYYADDPFNTNKDEDAATSSSTPANPSSLGMMRGAPPPTQITMKALVLPASTTTEPEPVKGVSLNPDLKTKGPWRRYEIDVAANPADISFPTTTKGDRFGALEFITYVYDKDGVVILLRDEKTHATKTPQQYSDFLRGSVLWHQEISVPAKGDYFLRIGIHDLMSDKMGGVEVPISTVEHLAPATATPSPQAGKSTPPAASRK